MIIAVDKGTTFTKTENISFKSTIREYKEDEINFSQDKIIVKYNNKKYVIGDKGKTNTDLFKSKQEETKLLILTAIVLDNPEEPIKRVKLVTGLPIGRYAEERYNMIKLFENTKNELWVNGLKYIVEIKETEVFPEGASSFYYVEADEGLVIDIGGLSVDIAQFNKGKVLNKYSTYKMGIMPLYRQIANRLNNKYSLSLDEWDIEDKIKNGLFINGHRININADDLINNHVQQILQAIEFEYDLPIIKNVFITGGGGYLLYPYFKEKIKRVQLMPEPQFSNIHTYKILAEVLFNEKG